MVGSRRFEQFYQRRRGQRNSKLFQRPCDGGNIQKALPVELGEQVRNCPHHAQASQRLCGRIYHPGYVFGVVVSAPVECVDQGLARTGVSQPAQRLHHVHAVSVEAFLEDADQCGNRLPVPYVAQRTGRSPEHLILVSLPKGVNQHGQGAAVLQFTQGSGGLGTKAVHFFSEASVSHHLDEPRYSRLQVLTQVELQERRDPSPADSGVWILQGTDKARCGSGVSDRPERSCRCLPNRIVGIAQGAHQRLHGPLVAQ